MYLRKIRTLRNRKQSRKDVILASVVVFLLYTAVLNISAQVDSDVSNDAREHIFSRRENVTRSVTVVAPSGGQTNNTKVAATVLITKKPVDTHGCREWFENSFEDNLGHISRYLHKDSNIYMHKIASNATKPKTFKTDFPVIATAASSSFYDGSQGLLKSIYEKLLPKYNVKVVYYDMGLSDHQRRQLEEHCDICEVRTFSFDGLPDHLRKLQTYAWKPVIVKTLLMEFGWVWWMDSSVRFVTNDLDRALKYSLENSFLFFTYGVSLAVAQQTDVQTMKYLGEDPCKFRHFGEVEATFVLFHFDHVSKVVVDQWVSCALSEACIAPAGTQLKLQCSISKKQDGRCHRFDQAVLSVLLRRLYHVTNDYPLVTEPFHIHVIKRGDSVSYFPK